MDEVQIPTVAAIESLREEIDAIDKAIFELIEKRARCARAIGKLKAEGAVYRPEREREILERAVMCAKGHGSIISEASVRSIVREVVSACRAVEELPRVAFLGPLGTFTEEAVIKQFGSSFEPLACTSLDDVFHEATSGTAAFAVVPVENSTEGIVTRTADLLFTTDLKAIGEVNVAVHHNVMNLSGKLDAIRTVKAHPQALAQCRAWLATNLPNARTVSSSSNAQAAKEAAQDPTCAALAAERAAHLYDLKIAAHAVEDDPRNRTRFLVLGKEFCGKARGVRHKTSLIFSVANRAGALLHALEPFNRHGVQMVRLESRPSRNGAWEYNFFVDIEGHDSDPAVAAAVKELGEIALFVKTLGSYPCAL